jgi:hypothetical protein
MKRDRYESIVEQYVNRETRERVLFLRVKRSVYFFHKVPRLHPVVLLIRAV